MKFNFMILKVMIGLAVLLSASQAIYAHLPCGEGTDIECPGSDDGGDGE